MGKNKKVETNERDIIKKTENETIKSNHHTFNFTKSIFNQRHTV